VSKEIKNLNEGDEMEKTYLSSQRDTIQDIVETKREAKDYEVQVISIGDYLSELGIEDGYIVIDGHHSHEAAIQDGVRPIYIVVDDPEGLTDPEKIMEARYVDCGWYDIETGQSI
jgi:hypothetical protein